jgi:NADPH:quinone reductase
MRGYVTDPRGPGGLTLAGDLPEPEPAPDELVLEVGAYAVNRGELHLLTQRPDGWRPGQDVAGVVARAAADGSGPPEGTRVVAIVDGAGWSERVAAGVHRVAALPDGVGLEAAAALPVAGLTALRALRAGAPLLGRSVLVTGATGGVGQFAVQLAVAAGARVTAHVSAPERAEEARGLGAHDVVVSLDDPALGRPFTLVLDGVGGAVLRDAVHRLAPGGTAASYGVLGGAAELALPDFAGAPGAKVTGFFVFGAAPESELGPDLATLAGFVADGRLAPRLGLVRDWEAMAEVLDALRARRVRGKAVLTRG